METTDEEAVRAAVRKTYGGIAAGAVDGCSTGGCCGGASAPAAAIGYSDAEARSVPQGSNLGLGCGNPQVIAALRPGERVLDLGSGAGFDVFLAAQRVGPTGRVIGVDMTPEMVARARAHAAMTASGNVEFRLGEIERLPVADASVDVVLSNCVINLSPDKPAVFREAFRVLVPGGRLAVADVVAVQPIPDVRRTDLTGYAGCVSGAAPVAALERMLHDAGFRDVRVDTSAGLGVAAGDDVASALIQAVRP